MNTKDNGSVASDSVSITLQPETNSAIAPEDTFGTYAYRIIRKTVKRTVKYESAVLKDTDPEPLHQMRVGMRRLRSTLHICSPALQLPQSAGDRSIRKLARCLGSLRDLDVLIEKLQDQYRPTVHGKARKSIDDVIKTLHKQRRQRFVAVKTMLNGDRYHRFKSAYTDWLADPQYQAIATYPAKTIIPDVLAPVMSQLLLHPGWLFCVIPEQLPLTASRLSPNALQHALIAQGSVLHDLRKQIKRIRYQAEFFEDLCPEFASRLQDFKVMQDALGQIQDCAVLRSTLSTYVGKRWSQNMEAIARLIQQDEESAWQLWQPYQAQYLQAEYRTQIWLLICTSTRQPDSPDLQ